MESPLVSIVVLNYNGKQWLRQCLTSLQRMNYPNYEVILVDNSSDDGSIESMPADFTSVKLVKNKENLGYAEGNNVGLKHAKGDFVAILNMDTEVSPDWVSELVKIAVSNPRIGACGGKVYDYKDRTKMQYPSNLIIPSGAYDQIQTVWANYGAGFLAKRSVLRRIGLFDSEYFCYYEELDLFWRMRLAGFHVLFVPTSIMYHFRGGGKMEDEFKIFLNFRNRLRTILKNSQIRTLPSYVPILSLELFYPILLLLLPRKRKTAFLRIRACVNALTWNLIRLRGTMRERVRIQRLREVPDKELGVLSTDYAYLYFSHNHRIDF